MSDTIEIVLLLRLVVAGAAKSNIRNEKIVRRLETARWIEQSGRKGEWRPRDDAATKLEQRLDGLLPTWQLDVALLNRLGQSPYDVNAIAALPALRRQVVPSGMVNRRNWNAAKGVGPKHRARLAAETRLTKDWGIRFRPNRGLIARFADQVLDLFETRAILSECFIPERAWLRF